MYPPNELQQQMEFPQCFTQYLMSNTDAANLIAGGDWNVDLHTIGKKGGALWKPNMYQDNLVSMMTEFELFDIFRKQNPSKLSFT